MAKQIVVESCGGCPYSKVEFLDDKIDFRCDIDGHTTGRDVMLPDCPLPDVPQAGTTIGNFEHGFIGVPLPAAGPWLPMSVAPKDGTDVLLELTKTLVIVGYFDSVNWLDTSGRKISNYSMPPLRFAYINKLEVVL